MKDNVCRNILNCLPDTTRLAYIHLPYWANHKTRDPLFDYDLNREWAFRRGRQWMDYGEYLGTEAGEQVSSFLYVKNDDRMCRECGSLSHQEHGRSGKRCPQTSRCTQAQAEESRKRRARAEPADD